MWGISFEPKPLSMQMEAWQQEWQSWTTPTLCEGTFWTSLKRPSNPCTRLALFSRGASPVPILGELVSSVDLQGLQGRENPGYLLSAFHPRTRKAMIPLEEFWRSLYLWSVGMEAALRQRPINPVHLHCPLTKAGSSALTWGRTK